MKITAFILLIGCLHVCAHGFSQKVTISVKDAPVQKVFREILLQTGVSIVYDEKLFDHFAPVSIHVKDAPIQSVLDECLKGQPFSYQIENDVVTIRAAAPDLREPLPEAIEITPSDSIRGRVLDENGQPVPGAYVRLNLTAQSYYATVTNEQGVFTLAPAPSSSTLIISGVNIETSVVPVGKKVYQMIYVKHRVTALNDVNVTVNTGVQILNKERTTGSFGKPDMETFANRTSSLDLIGRLDGLVPGVEVLPGSANLNVNLSNGVTTQRSIIRGISSVSLSNNVGPLYVVNGVIVPDFNSIDVDDVADITVLKDAAAAAIWGAQAANGVVVVTTRQGLKNSRITISYKGFVNFQGKPSFKYAPYMNSAQYIETMKQVFDPVDYPWASQYATSMSPSNLILYNQYRGLISSAQANASLDSLASINNDRQILDLFYRSGLTTNHTISASGGNNVYSFYGSLGYSDVVSNTPGQKNNSYRLNLTQSLNPNKNITVTINTALANNVTSGENYPQVTNSFLPYQLFENASGQPLYMNYLMGFSDSLRQNYQAKSGINLDYSPLTETKLLTNSTNNLSINTTGNIAVRLYKGLSFQGTYGYLVAPGTNTAYDDHTSKDQRLNLLYWTVAPTIGSTPTYYWPNTGGQYAMGSNQQKNWTVRNQLIYQSTLRKGRDNIDIQVGQEAHENYSYSTTNTLYGYNQQTGAYTLMNFPQLESGVLGTIQSGFSFFYGQPYLYSTNLNRFESYFALGSYTLSGKYSLDLSWREDHSNLFGSDVSAQNKPAFSVGGKWNLKKESFLRTTKWLNDLAVRATYGITGNSPYTGGATQNDVVYANTAAYSPGAIGGNFYAISSPSDNTLSWETTHTINAGIDFATLDNRLLGSLDLYHKYTNNLLNGVPLNPFSGFTSLSGNLGSLQNVGAELSLTSINIRERHFTWKTSFVFSFNRNKLLHYVQSSSSFNTPSYWLQGGTVQGYSLNPVFAYRYAGLDSLGDPQAYLANHTKVKTNANVQTTDLRYMGSSTPPFNGGVSNTFSYRGISLAANMIYNLGAVMRLQTPLLTPGLPINTSFSNDNLLTAFMNRWQKPGDEAHTNIPSYVGNSSLNNSRRYLSYYYDGDINVISASYAKIRDLTLSYALPAYLLKPLNVRNIEVFGQATNFMVWKANHAGIDPEYGYAPHAPHSYSLGANVTF